MKAFLEVDLEDVPEVAQFIERLRMRRTAGTEATGNSIFVPGQGAWSEAEIRLLCVRLMDRGEMQAATLSLLDRCAAGADAWVDKSVVDADFEGRALQGQLSGLTRMLKSKHLLGTFRDYWPVEYRKEFVADVTVSQYRMPEQVAAWWITARSELAEERDDRTSD